MGAPLAIGGFLVATLVFLPEGVSAVQAALADKIQRSVNLSLGSSLSMIGLTIPAVRRAKRDLERVKRANYARPSD